VLPLVNTSGDQATSIFPMASRRELIAVLAKIPDLKVNRLQFLLSLLRENPRFRCNRSETWCRQSDRRQRGGNSGDRVRIVAELINAADGRSLWSETYDRD